MIIDFRLRPLFAPDTGTGAGTVTKDQAYKNMKKKIKPNTDDQTTAQTTIKTGARDKNLSDIENTLQKDVNRGLNVIDQTQGSTFNPIVGSPWAYEGFKEDVAANSKLYKKIEERKKAQKAKKAKAEADAKAQRKADLKAEREADLAKRQEAGREKAKLRELTKLNKEAENKEKNIKPQDYDDETKEKLRAYDLEHRDDEVKYIKQAYDSMMKNDPNRVIDFGEFYNYVKNAYDEGDLKNGIPTNDVGAVYTDPEDGNAKIVKNYQLTPEEIELILRAKKEREEFRKPITHAAATKASQKLEKETQEKAQEIKDNDAYNFFIKNAIPVPKTKEDRETLKKKGEAILEKEKEAINAIVESDEYKKEDEEIKELEKQYKAARKEITKKQTPYAIRNAFLIIDVIQKSLQNIGRALPQTEFSPAYTKTDMEEPELFKLWREQIEKQQAFRNKSIESQLDTVTKTIANTYGVSEDEIKRLFNTDEDLRKAIYKADLDEDMMKRSVEFMYELNKLKSDKLLDDETLKVLELAYIYDHAGDLGSIRAASRKYFANNKDTLKGLFSALKYGSKAAGGVAAILDGLSSIPGAGPIFKGIANGIRGMSFEGMSDGEIIDFIWATAKKEGYTDEQIDDAFTKIDASWQAVNSNTTSSSVELPNGGGSVDFEHQTGDEEEGDDVNVKKPDKIRMPDGTEIDMQGDDVSYAPQAQDVDAPKVAKLEAQELPHVGSNVGEVDTTLTTKVKNGEDTYQDFIDYVDNAHKDLPYDIDNEKMADVMYLMARNLKRGEVADEDMQGILDDLLDPSVFLDGDKEYSQDARRYALRNAYNSIYKDDKQYRTLNNAVREVERLQKLSVYGDTPKIRKEAGEKASKLLIALDNFGIDDEDIRSNMLLWEYAPLIQTITSDKYSDDDEVYVTEGKNGDRVFAYESEREGTSPMNVGMLRKHFTKLYFDIEPDDPLRFPGHSFNSDYASGEDIWSTNISIKDMKDPEFWTEVPEEYKKRAEKEGVLAYQNYSDDRVVTTLEREFGMTRKQATELNDYLVKDIDANSKVLMEAILSSNSFTAKERERLRKELDKKKQELDKTKSDLTVAEDKAQREEYLRLVTEKQNNELKRDKRITTAFSVTPDLVKAKDGLWKQYLKDNPNVIGDAANIANTIFLGGENGLHGVNKWLSEIEKHIDDFESGRWNVHDMQKLAQKYGVHGNIVKGLTELAKGGKFVKAAVKTVTKVAQTVALPLAILAAADSLFNLKGNIAQSAESGQFYKHLTTPGLGKSLVLQTFNEEDAKHILDDMVGEDLMDFYRVLLRDYGPKGVIKSWSKDGNNYNIEVADKGEWVNSLRHSQMNAIRGMLGSILYNKTGARNPETGKTLQSRDILRALNISEDYDKKSLQLLYQNPYLYPLLEGNREVAKMEPKERQKFIESLISQYSRDKDLAPYKEQR
jgi:hypothetical protein